MPAYQAPLTDMRFLFSCLSDADQYAMDIEEYQFLLSQAAKFAEEKLAPSNALTDQQGCRFKQGKVLLEPEFKSLLQEYSDAGWLGLSLPEQWGGQGLPDILAVKVSEMLSSSNHALCMFSALTVSACKALMAFATDELKQMYLPKLVSGQWMGTMCLTEPQSGSDLGLIRTRAIINDDGSYSIDGTKIFISGGEHDAHENIIHLVLARIKGAPEGIKGLSLFAVPKLKTDGLIDNGVSCTGIEEKMGIHGIPTCTMAFDNAQGQIVGQPGQGIVAMFTMMNEMRIGAATQGVALSESAWQASYAYACERKQGKAATRAKQISAQPADSIVVHGDVRRMLLTQRAFAEGCRALCHYCASLLGSKNTPSLLELLTPIAKGFATETGLESASMAIQVYGGHGYIRESGVEQLYRDGRISTLYEGTTGVQSLDLLGRKVIADKGQTLRSFVSSIDELCSSLLSKKDTDPILKDFAQKLSPLTVEWLETSRYIVHRSAENPDEIGAVAYDFLMYSGYITLGYFWLKMAIAAQAELDNPNSDYSSAFIAEKLQTATFYFGKILPRTHSHYICIKNGTDYLPFIDKA